MSQSHETQFCQLKVIKDSYPQGCPLPSFKGQVYYWQAQKGRAVTLESNEDEKILFITL